MRNIKLLLSFVLTVMTLQSCTSSKDKAVNLVRDHVKGNLYNPESYKEAGVEIDSLFSVDGTLKVFIGFMEVVEMIPDIKELNAEINDAEDDMLIWDGYYPYSRKMHSDAVEKRNALIKKRDLSKLKIQERMMAYIDNRFSKEIHSLAGFFIAINYSAKTLGGDNIPGFSIYLVNSSADEIIYEKNYNPLELMMLLTEKSEPISKRILEYVDDYCVGSEGFDVDDFISYMSI